MPKTAFTDVTPGNILFVTPSDILYGKGDSDKKSLTWLR